MKLNTKNKLFFVLFLFLFLSAVHFRGETKSTDKKQEIKILHALHSISSHVIFEDVKELCSTKYEGRLTGTPGFNASAGWVSERFKEWGIKPAGDNGTYLQSFPNPYTLVFPGSQLALHVPVEKNTSVKKYYQYEIDFFPGSTSDTGEVTAEVVYVGYGITAPELKYDEYRGLNVKGKIVLMEREVPVSPDKEPDEFKKWRKYSFHQYKVKNARAHGAAGMLYNYHIVNPNCLFIKDFVLTYVGKSVVEDLFLGTKRDHKNVVNAIKKKRKSRSFRTRKVVTIKNNTEHHPEGIAHNVIGYLEGSDPVLKKEAVIIGAHLDHLGYNHKLMPGANDNSSGVAVVLAVAKVMTECPVKPRRSVIFILFGAEEQGVKGSEYYIKHPFFPNEKIVGFINLDGVGRGTKLVAIAAKNFPELWRPFQQANQRYIHRKIIPTHFHNLARPRLDAAHFMWASIPTISFTATGAKSLPHSIYHTTRDNLDIITPEIMEDLAQLIFLALGDGGLLCYFVIL